ncbi:EMG1/NEP1 methyltransferase (macronuclear) [Tetrahymena thermophila SB210]|uniref:EMG1/NEP1 methyltransferase n=1 Tax=Tetrahymena thermophila (strain SB210) TaxID=312017 RepID=Q237J4_TETTS|nr:EMG1/NEP1 methyltransferase [Tetrahymena thermophila SB210]EAR92747.1 EMG1/NEP1 methyltransferase [Tetrahymena thermophila SB210]|eukprot:XP_001012992.1 EMG1/NEP1 methyltransferase [Tetrahymena thermophila SB210]
MSGRDRKFNNNKRKQNFNDMKKKKQKQVKEDQYDEEEEEVEAQDLLQDQDESDNDVDLKKATTSSKAEEKDEAEKESEQKATEAEEDNEDFLTKDDVQDKRKVYVILEKCPLETAKLGKDFVLLNSDEHKGYISKKLKKDFSTYRPDIVHHSLLSLMDSPLNKAGLLQVYIHTENNVLIYISPNTKIPRTYKRFAALFAQLLTKLKVRAVQSSETLLKIVKNPVTQHLPSDAMKIGMSTQARLVSFKEYIEKLPKNKPVVYIVGGVSKGNPAMEVDYADEHICISKYGLSAGYCISRMMNCYEQMWNIN